MDTTVLTNTPDGVMTPIGPYSHIAKVGPFINIGAVAGVDPETGDLAGPDVATQTRRILESFDLMLASVGSDLNHIIHINVFLLDMADFEAMNIVYADVLQRHRPARTTIAVSELPKEAALITMNLTAVESRGWPAGTHAT